MDGNRSARMTLLNRVSLASPKTRRNLAAAPLASARASALSLGVDGRSLSNVLREMCFAVGAHTVLERVSGHAFGEQVPGNMPEDGQSAPTAQNARNPVGGTLSEEPHLRFGIIARPGAHASARRLWREEFHLRFGVIAQPVSFRPYRVRDGTIPARKPERDRYRTRSHDGSHR